MRFVFFGYDFSVDILERLMADGHEPIGIFTFSCDQVFAFNRQIYALADTYGIPITDKTITPAHISALLEDGCEVFLAAGYPRKIPPIDESKAYGLNIHPAYLPRARGITPAPYIILREPEAAGFTIHKLAPEYDAGDILYQENFPITEYDDVETLAARVALRAPDAASRIFENLPTYWKNAVKQDESKASSYPAVTLAQRTLNWSQNAQDLRQQGRAFGRFGVIAVITNNAGYQQKLAVFQFNAWEEKHIHPAGTLLRSSPREIIVAIKDGFACLKDFQIIG